MRWRACRSRWQDACTRRVWGHLRPGRVSRGGRGSWRPLPFGRRAATIVPAARGSRVADRRSAGGLHRAGTAVLSGQQAQRVLAERGLDLVPPGGPAGGPGLGHRVMPRPVVHGSPLSSSRGAAPAADLHFGEPARGRHCLLRRARSHAAGAGAAPRGGAGRPAGRGPAAMRIIQQRRAARRQPRAPAKSVNRTPTATPELPPKAAGQR